MTLHTSEKLKGGPLRSSSRESLAEDYERFTN
jgi:hypothetical protein